MSKKKGDIQSNPKLYKGYDIGWLRGFPEHPDYYLVAEFEALKGK